VKNHALHLAREGGPDSRLIEALQAYWMDNPLDATAHLQGILTDDNVDRPLVWQAYRLWIQCLVKVQDVPGLVALAEHFFNMGQNLPGEHEVFFALRGLVHFELDEFAAARLAATALVGAADNTYALELVQRVARRLKGSFQRNPPHTESLFSSKMTVIDYVHWEILVQAVVEEGDGVALEILCKHLIQVFPKSPLPHVVEYHRCIDGGYFAAAATVAERLCELNPASVDYLYDYAYALFEDGDYPTARKVLQRIVQERKVKDADVVGLLGHAHARLGSAEDALICLQDSMDQLRQEGLPYSQVAIELREVTAEVRGEDSEESSQSLREPQVFILELSPRRAHELLSSPENTVERLLRPMGSSPDQGDMCFFVTRGSEPSQWKIIALYAVDSAPMWHPIHGEHSVLKLVTLYPQGVPIATEALPLAAEWDQLFADLPTNLRDGWRDVEALARRFGVVSGGAPHALPRPFGPPYGLRTVDAEGLFAIEAAVSRHREELERRRSLETRRPTA
jgi:tetratricopeptide (TPR) repeat protein